MTGHRFRFRVSLSSTFPLVLSGIIGLGLIFTAIASAQPETQRAGNGPKPTVVLVHGAWADASSWNKVIKRLQQQGYTVVAPPNPLRGVASDAAQVASVLATISGPIVLVGHSYGGMVITNAALGNKNVKALVYIAAFIPEQGESALSLGTKFPGSLIVPPGVPGATLNAVPTPTSLDLYINTDSFRKLFAADVPADKTALMAATQRPISLAAFQEASGEPAWKTILTWALVATEDKAIGTANSRFMGKRAAGHNEVEISASHVVMISHPEAVVDMIKDADKHTR
jgi:pimeloyl-ACP methyl ester carboxylesterase